MCNQHFYFVISLIIIASILIPTFFKVFFPSIRFDSDKLKASLSNHAAIEEQILKETVRIEIESWTVRDGEVGYDFDIKTSHATVMEDRYLVTHNHFSTAFTDQNGSSESETYRSVRLSNTDGEVLFQGPLSDFSVVWEDSETLVIGYKDETLFSRLGFESAEFVDGTAVPFRPDMEVAQVDWDGTRTWVEWTTIESVQVEDGVPVLILDGDILVGASGGGVFWHGLHVANNWTVINQVDASDMVVGSTTKVALNSAVVTGHSVAGLIPAGKG